MTRRALRVAGTQMLDQFVRIGAHTYDRAYVYQLRGIIACLCVIKNDARRIAKEPGVKGPDLTRRWLWQRMLTIEPVRALLDVARHDKTLQESGLADLERSLRADRARVVQELLTPKRRRGK